MDRWRGRTAIATAIVMAVAPTLLYTVSGQAQAGPLPHVTSLAAAAGDNTCAAREPSPIGAADNPIGVPFETLSADPSGAIRVDEVPAAGTSRPGRLNYAVISRADRSCLMSGNVAADAAGLAELRKTASADVLAKKYLMVVSGASGIPGAPAADIRALFLQLGVGDAALTPDVLQSLTTQSAPFSVLGIPGAARGTGWLNAGLVAGDTSPVPPFRLPPTGDIAGYLQWNITTNQYDFVDEQFPEFSTDTIHDGLPTGVMRFNGDDYPASVTAGTSGFHVLVADAVNLHVLANQTLPTNGGPTPVTTLQEAFARELKADTQRDGFQQFYAAKAPPLILLQSYGHPFGASQAWQNAADTIAELGGNPLAFLGLKEDSGSFSLAGRLGGSDYTALASSYTGNPGPLSGVLTRTRTMAFEPAATGPLNGINSQMIALAYQRPQPFQPFTGGEAKAAAWIGFTLKLCTAEAGCNVRQAYWSKYRAKDWLEQAVKLGRLGFPLGAGFTKDAFDAVQSKLIGEFTDVYDVKRYFAELAEVFSDAQSATQVNIKAIGDKVLDNVKPPAGEHSAFPFDLVKEILGFVEPEEEVAQVFIKALSAVLSLVAGYVDQSGQPTLPEKITTKTGELAQVLSRELTMAADTFGVIGRLIASDNGKLQKFQSLASTPEWELEPSRAPARRDITKAAQEWFASQLVPAAFPWLITAWGATPNDLSCYYYTDLRHPVKVHVKPWSDEPAQAQLREVVAFQDGHPVTQSVFFGGAFHKGAHTTNPNDSLAAYLFGTDAEQVGLNRHSFISKTTFGDPHRVTNDRGCP
jgi:hypothetical protein